MVDICAAPSFGAAFLHGPHLRPNPAFERTCRYVASCLFTSVAARRSTCALGITRRRRGTVSHLFLATVAILFAVNAAAEECLT